MGAKNAQETDFGLSAWLKYRQKALLCLTGCFRNSKYSSLHGSFFQLSQEAGRCSPIMQPR